MKKWLKQRVKLVPIILFLLSLLVGLAVWGGTGDKVMGAIVSLIGITLDIAWANVISILERFEDRLNLQCERTNEDFQIIADSINFLVKEANITQTNNSRLIGKRLNGVKEMILRRGLEEASTREAILAALETCRERFIATSLCNPSEWMDPHWFTYLTRQIAECTKKRIQKSTFISKRYYINSLKEIKRYAEELLLLYKAHKVKCKKNIVAVDVFVIDKDILCKNFQSFINSDFTYLKRLRNVDKEIPDFICIDNNFWFRDPNNDYKLTKANSISSDPSQTFSVEHLEEWIKILEKIEKADLPNLLYNEEGLIGFLTLEGAA
jgi:hypothetical protein